MCFKRKKEMLYTIKKGQHYSTKTLSLLYTDTIRFTLRFNESAIYSLQTNKTDINKAYGFTEGLFGDSNSARIGWRWDIFDGQVITQPTGLYLFPYVHYKGENLGAKDPAPLGFYQLNTDIPCVIQAQGEEYVFSAGKNSVVTPRGGRSLLKRLNFPYFGGQEVAPHDISIEIKKL